MIDIKWHEQVAALRKHLDGIEIYTHNIGRIRGELMLPFDCPWNGAVRDETAARENKEIVKGASD